MDHQGGLQAWWDKRLNKSGFYWMQLAGKYDVPCCLWAEKFANPCKNQRLYPQDQTEAQVPDPQQSSVHHLLLPLHTTSDRDTCGNHCLIKVDNQQQRKRVDADRTPNTVGTRSAMKCREKILEQIIIRKPTSTGTDYQCIQLTQKRLVSDLTTSVRSTSWWRFTTARNNTLVMEEETCRGTLSGLALGWSQSHQR